MKVLSLFDGMSCGMIAFKQLGISVEEYHAFEIDKYAVKVSQHNFPEIIHHGDVFQGDFTKFKGFDWLIGGSPCTYWSIAQNPEKRETTASGTGWELFQQYVRALHEAEPEYFLYENNDSMASAIRESISEAFGFEPVMINSALVSAQSRKRLYWTGRNNGDGTYSRCMIPQPEDRKIFLKDIIESDVQPVMLHNIYGGFKEKKPRIFFEKSPTIRTSAGGGHLPNLLLKGILHDCITLENAKKFSRMITVSECMKLQTVPDWYDFSVISDTQAYKCLGNGWTVEVIMHLISQALQNKTEPCFLQLGFF